MSTILVSGAASGLGLAFLKAYASTDTPTTLIAIDKDPIPTEEIKHGNEGSKLFTHQIDITSQSSIDEMVSKISNLPIDMIIHSAGIRGLVPSQEDVHPGDVAACETLSVMDLDTLLRTFHINVAGTFMLVRALLPNLKHSPASKVIVMSSRMGSVGQNTSGSAYAYRASKAALNATIKSLSLDVPEVSFVLCHPGRVETNLVRCKEEGAISADESVQGLLPLIAKWNEEDTGKFYDRFGDPILW